MKNRTIANVLVVDPSDQSRGRELARRFAGLLAAVYFYDGRDLLIADALAVQEEWQIAFDPLPGYDLVLLHNNDQQAWDGLRANASLPLVRYTGGTPPREKEPAAQGQTWIRARRVLCAKDVPSLKEVEEILRWGNALWANKPSFLPSLFLGEAETPASNPLADKLGNKLHDVKVLKGEEAKGKTLERFVLFKEALAEIGEAVFGEQNRPLLQRVSWAIARINDSKDFCWGSVAHQEREMIQRAYARSLGKGEDAMEKILLAVDDHLYDETCDPQGKVSLSEVFEGVAAKNKAGFVGLTSKKEALAYFANEATRAEAARVACLFLDVKFDREGETAGSDLGRELSKYNIPIVYLTSKGMREAQIGYVPNRFFYQNKDSLYAEQGALATITKALMNDCYNDTWTLSYTNGQKSVHLEGPDFKDNIELLRQKDPQKYKEAERYQILQELMTGIVQPFLRDGLGLNPDGCTLDEMTQVLLASQGKMQGESRIEKGNIGVGVNKDLADYCLVREPGKIVIECTFQPGARKPEIPLHYDLRDEVAKFKDYFTNQLPKKLNHTTWGIFDRDFCLCVGKVRIVLPVESHASVEAVPVAVAEKGVDLAQRVTELEGKLEGMEDKLAQILAALQKQ